MTIMAEQPQPQKEEWYEIPPWNNMDMLDKSGKSGYTFKEATIIMGMVMLFFLLMFLVYAYIVTHGGH